MAESERKEARSVAAPAQQEPKLREKSTVVFPYLDLDDSSEVAKAVHEIGGGECQLEQLAARLKMAVGGGGFRLRLIAAKMYGLLQYSRDAVTLSELGKRLCDPMQEKHAKADAFLNVPLYSQIYDKYKGVTLPQSLGLEQAMVTLGVVTKQKDKARQVFQRSANQAGFFAYGPDRLTLPIIKGNDAPLSPGADALKEKKENVKSASGGNDGGWNYHPFIEGLLRALPEDDAQWAIEKRAKWLQAAANIFDLIYTASDDSKTLTISVS